MIRDHAALEAARRITRAIKPEAEPLMVELVASLILIAVERDEAQQRTEYVESGKRPQLVKVLS